MRRDSAVLTDVEDSLIAEQGGICAYTGMRIAIKMVKNNRFVDFHIEHLRPQVHCSYGQSAAYDNMVACWPRPNCDFEPEFGARKKDKWPSQAEEALFVSPLRADCSARFTFNRHGEIKAVNSADQMATMTIAELGLDDKELTALRRNAIWGAFHPNGKHIRLSQARHLHSALENDSQALNKGANVQLIPFCFAIQKALEPEIRKLEGIEGNR